MKRKILVLLLAISALFIIACGKSKEKKIDTTLVEKKVDLDERNLKKYNTYVNLYNLLISSNNIIDLFDEGYTYNFGINKNEMEEPKIIEKLYNPNLIITDFNNQLDLVKKRRKEKPDYKIDDNVDELVVILEKLVEKMPVIYEYYDEKFYIDDDYKQGKKYHNEYVQLFDELIEKFKIFDVEIKKLEEVEEKLDLNEYEKNGEIAKLNLSILNKKIKNFLKIIFNYNENGEFSKENIKELKEIKNDLFELHQKLSVLEEKQLKKEEILNDNLSYGDYKEKFLPKIEKIAKYTESLIIRVEKKSDNRDIQKRIDEISYMFLELDMYYQYMGYYGYLGLGVNWTGRKEILN